MMGFKLTIWICFHLAVAFSEDVASSCQGGGAVVCSSGQYVVYVQNGVPTCVDCPLGTYIDFESHICESCKKHTQPGFNEVILRPGRSGTDNVIVCKKGYFRSAESSSCERCSVCQSFAWAARECNAEEDTLCCTYGMVAGPSQEGGSLSCVHRRSRRAQHGGQVISSDNSDHNATDEHSDHQHSGSDSNPNHGFSKADSDAEHHNNRTEFPVWARILCAGVAIGVFLFYLGVGIPCNACGSRDKLRVLRKWMFNQNQPVPTEEVLTEKPTEKTKPLSEQV